MCHGRILSVLLMSMLIQDLPGYWKYYCLIIFGCGYLFTVFRCVSYLFLYMNLGEWSSTMTMIESQWVSD